MAATRSWNEIKASANRFVAEWEGATSERAESQSFWNEWFEVFGVRRRRVATFERRAKRIATGSAHGRIDVFWPGMVLVEHKSTGESLDAAVLQAEDYLELEEREFPRMIIVCDFANFKVIDLENENQEHCFTLKQFPSKVHLFGFIAGYEKQRVTDEPAVNRKAAELMGEIHDALAKSNYVGSDLEILLVRLLFCMFAEDSGVFEPGLFTEYLETRTADDGSDLGPKLIALFDVLDTPEGARQSTLDEPLNSFPYVNGGLFKSRLKVAHFDRNLRKLVLKAAGFRWSDVSPAIFGSMFQSIMNVEQRRLMGAHYTSETNILRVIQPLFLDKLRTEFEGILRLKVGRKKRLDELHNKLAGIKLLDPACGCGNFLVVAYRELRQLEFEILRELLREKSGALDLDMWLRIDVDQFAGIEIDEWPARIAETALWLTDHLMNRKLMELGQVYTRLPLRASPRIVRGNALRMDWNAVIESKDVAYVLGNPPFVGKQYQTAEQKGDLKMLFGALDRAGTLDYVCGWYAKAADYIKGTSVEVAFVSTKSITHGEQVAPFWDFLGRYPLHVNFAHRPFRWLPEGQGAPAVQVVVVGFSPTERSQKTVFEYPDVSGSAHATQCKYINKYLLPDAVEVTVRMRQDQISGVPPARYGSMPNDGGNLLLDEGARATLLGLEPKAEKFIRPFMGADEFLYGVPRYCLWLVNATPSELSVLPNVQERVRRVKAYRLNSRRKQTQLLAGSPQLFGEIRQPTSRYLLFPEVSSETRKYIPIGFVDANVIASNLVRTIEGVGLYEFGVLTSEMMMAWVRTVAGRLEGRFRFSTKLVYNTFPWPENVPVKAKAAVEKAAQAVLDARLAFPGEPLEKLYDPVLMPAGLTKAHRKLDAAVDRCYAKKKFGDDIGRIRFLLERYRDKVASTS